MITRTLGGRALPGSGPAARATVAAAQRSTTTPRHRFNAPGNLFRSSRPDMVRTPDVEVDPDASAVLTLDPVGGDAIGFFPEGRDDRQPVRTPTDHSNDPGTEQDDEVKGTE